MFLHGEYKNFEIPGIIALIAAVLSIVVKEAMYWYTRGVAKKINSSAVMADAWHHRSDALSSIGSFIRNIRCKNGIFSPRLNCERNYFNIHNKSRSRHIYRNNETTNRRSMRRRDSRKNL